MATLERAISIAAEAHAEQLDKAGAPYILHVMRVMLAQDTNEARIVAALHDVVEDCGWTAEGLLAEGFSPEVVDAVLSVTRRDQESYEAFIQRAAGNRLGRVVKLADLRDNADLRRIANPSPADIARTEKYCRSIAIIERKISNG